MSHVKCGIIPIKIINKQTVQKLISSNEPIYTAEWRRYFRNDWGQISKSTPIQTNFDN